MSGAAENALTRAAQEARALRHGHVGPEHLVLALLEQRDTLAGQVLANVGITRVQVIEVLSHALALNLDGVVAKPRPNAELAAVSARSLREAPRGGSRYITTEYQLLGVVVDGHNLGARVLTGLGLTATDVRALLGQPADLPDSADELADDLVRLTKENAALRAAITEMRPVFDRSLRAQLEAGSQTEREDASHLVDRVVAGEFGDPRGLG